MITVLMPTYNCAEFLPFSIKSILNQTFSQFELLIIDDGSTDNTEEIVFGFEDTRIHYLKIEHVGFVDSLNYGLKNAKYDLIVRMDADDIAHPDLLGTLFCIHRNEPEFDVISCLSLAFCNTKPMYIIEAPQNHDSIIRNLALHSCISHPGSFFSKSKIIEISNGYPNYDGISDYALWLKIKDHVRFYNIQKVLIYYRVRNNSLSRKSLDNYKKSVYQLQQPHYLKDISAEFGISPKRINETRGWREYFYGSKKEARKIWGNSLLLLNWKVLLAFFFTFLPEKLLSNTKELRLRYRLKYFVTYFKKENKNLRNYLKHLLD